MSDDIELVLAAPDFGAELAFWTARGWRLDAIWPADDPRVARLGGTPRLRLDRDATGPVTLRSAEGAPATSPAGHRIEVGPTMPAYVLPEVQTGFGLRRLADGDPWVIGRAGMRYRDLVPDRLGGAIIASHIRIPDGGPVPDMVHYHTIGFQLIWCYKGWVDLVYEDQGPPFRLTAGSCVIQPPEIRHRVLHASDGIEVVEIGVPAVHVTTIDHAMELPNGPAVPERRFQGQSFVHHRAEDADWTDSEPGLSACETGISAATAGVAGVRVLRPLGGPVRFTPAADIHFVFVLDGALILEAGGGRHAVGPADAFVLPPGEEVGLSDIAPGTELLEVALPGR